MAILTTIIGSVALVAAITVFIPLLRNNAAARRTRLPYLVYPFDPRNFLWLIVSPIIRPWLQRHLPSALWKRLALTIYGWEFFEKRRPFTDFGYGGGHDRSFLVVGSGGLDLFTVDPVVVTDVLRRPSDFMMPPVVGWLFAQFGHNVLTTNGERWSRQRKVIAGVVNERIAKSIFDATITQTTGMVEELAALDKASSVDTSSFFDMIKKITINVLSDAGMGTKVSWRDHEAEKAATGFQMTYLESCKVVIESVTGPLMLPTSMLLKWPSWMPGHSTMHRLGIAKTEFPIHTKALLDQERGRIASSKTAESRSNIMSQLILASSGDSTQRLTEDELNGNLFLFTAAGFETTANTLSYAMVLLARYPQWQEWLDEEIRQLVSNDKPSDLDYASVYPQALRIQAVMYETLRLYPPIVHLLKTTTTAQRINTSEGPVDLPADTSVCIGIVGLHLDPSVWRGVNHDADPSWVVRNNATDEYEFRPSRWMKMSTGASPALYQPPKGYFIPWGYGPRVCPGQKMGQVEFVAAMLKILERFQISVKSLPGESQADVEARLDATLAKSVPKMTLTMEGMYNAGSKGLCVQLKKKH